MVQIIASRTVRRNNGTAKTAAYYPIEKSTPVV
jgi:hypothetical protein